MASATGSGPSAMSSQRSSRLLFDGDERNYELWESRFLAHLELRGLSATIQVEPVIGGGEDADALRAADTAKNAQAYAELVHVLDNKSVSLIRREADADGRKALRILREHYAVAAAPSPSPQVPMTPVKKTPVKRTMSADGLADCESVKREKRGFSMEILHQKLSYMAEQLSELNRGLDSLDEELGFLDEKQGFLDEKLGFLEEELDKAQAKILPGVGEQTFLSGNAALPERVVAEMKKVDPGKNMMAFFSDLLKPLPDGEL